MEEMNDDKILQYFFTVMDAGREIERFRDEDGRVEMPAYMVMAGLKAYSENNDFSGYMEEINKDKLYEIEKTCKETDFLERQFEKLHKIDDFNRLYSSLEEEYTPQLTSGESFDTKILCISSEIDDDMVLNEKKGVEKMLRRLENGKNTKEVLS